MGECGGDATGCSRCRAEANGPRAYVGLEAPQSCARACAGTRLVECQPRLCARAAQPTTPRREELQHEERAAVRRRGRARCQRRRANAQDRADPHRPGPAPRAAGDGFHSSRGRCDTSIRQAGARSRRVDHGLVRKEGDREHGLRGVPSGRAGDRGSAGAELSRPRGSTGRPPEPGGPRSPRRNHGDGRAHPSSSSAVGPGHCATELSSFHCATPEAIGGRAAEPVRTSSHPACQSPRIQRYRRSCRRRVDDTPRAARVAASARRGLQVVAQDAVRGEAAAHLKASTSIPLPMNEPSPKTSW